MKRIAKCLIHLLGGVTAEESIQSDTRNYRMGCIITLHILKSKADLLYGVPAEDWCHCIYDYINSEISSYEDHNETNPAAEAHQ